MSFFNRSGNSPTRRPVVKRAFTGLVGMPLDDSPPAATAVLTSLRGARLLQFIPFDVSALCKGGTVDLPPLTLGDEPKKKRGRPPKNGVKKTAAEIKREQRQQQRELKASVKESQQLQSDIYNAAHQIEDAERNLKEATGANDLLQVHTLLKRLDNLRAELKSLKDQGAYQFTIAVQEESDRKIKDKVPSMARGENLRSAPHGTGRLIYGAEADSNSGLFTINGKITPTADTNKHGRRIGIPKKYNSALIEKGKVEFKEKDVVWSDADNVDAWKDWIEGKPESESKWKKWLNRSLSGAESGKCHLLEEPVCCADDCKKPASEIHPDDQRLRLQDKPRFLCRGHFEGIMWTGLSHMVTRT